MNAIGKLGIGLCLVGALGYGRGYISGVGGGRDYTGKLMDASCYDREGKHMRGVAEKCAPTASTSAFVFRTSEGRLLKLDSDGNAKAETAIESGVLKSGDDGMRASIIGRRHHDMLEVSSIMHHDKGVY